MERKDEKRSGVGEEREWLVFQNVMECKSYKSHEGNTTMTVLDTHTHTHTRSLNNILTQQLYTYTCTHMLNRFLKSQIFMIIRYERH